MILPSIIFPSSPLDFLLFLAALPIAASFPPIFFLFFFFMTFLSPGRGRRFAGIFLGGAAGLGLANEKLRENLNFPIILSVALLIILLILGYRWWFVFPPVCLTARLSSAERLRARRILANARRSEEFPEESPGLVMIDYKRIIDRKAFSPQQLFCQSAGLLGFPQANGKSSKISHLQESLSASLLSPHCPHLGANLTAASEIVQQGNSLWARLGFSSSSSSSSPSIRCSFHCWEFSASSGACVKIPYLTKGRKIPESAKLVKFSLLEDARGFLWVRRKKDGSLEERLAEEGEEIPELLKNPEILRILLPENFQRAAKIEMPGLVHHAQHAILSKASTIEQLETGSFLVKIPFAASCFLVEFSSPTLFVARLAEAPPSLALVASLVSTTSHSFDFRSFLFCRPSFVSEASGVFEFFRSFLFDSFSQDFPSSENQRIFRLWTEKFGRLDKNAKSPASLEW